MFARFIKWLASLFSPKPEDVMRDYRRRARYIKQAVAHGTFRPAGSFGFKWPPEK